MNLRSLISPSNMSVVQRIGIVAVIIQRATVVVKRSKFSISFNHNAAPEEN